MADDFRQVQDVLGEKSQPSREAHLRIAAIREEAAERFAWDAFIRSRRSTRGLAVLIAEAEVVAAAGETAQGGWNLE